MPSPIGEYMTTALLTVLERILIIFSLDLDISNLPETTDSVHSIIFLLKRDNLELRQPYITGSTKYEALGRAIRANPTGYSLVPVEADKNPYTTSIGQIIGPKNEVDDTVRIAVALGGRRICLSSDGYNGVIPNEAKEIDSIYVFPGIRVPYIVHEHEDGDTLIGDCYIPGLMEGEAVKKVGEGLLEMQTISLMW
jgi:hypothetical protein